MRFQVAPASVERKMAWRLLTWPDKYSVGEWLQGAALPMPRLKACCTVPTLVKLAPEFAEWNNPVPVASHRSPSAAGEGQELPPGTPVQPVGENSTAPSGTRSKRALVLSFSENANGLTR